MHAFLAVAKLLVTFGVLTSVPILVKIDQEMRPRECQQRHRQTDANLFYNLSHAVCYSYGTDKNANIVQKVTSQGQMLQK